MAELALESTRSASSFRALTVEESIQLEWSNIALVVNDGTGEGTKRILSSQGGSAQPGELLAVMGSSGAGKSTLLDILAGRLPLGVEGIAGQIFTNGEVVQPALFRRRSGYVMQSDALFPLLTVRETFQYAASLRISNATYEQKMEAAENLIKLLGLEKCADGIVGNEDNRGISGGEKRRVSIGVDIVHQPAVIFLDEPTSGLDSTTALSLVESLKQLAVDRNCTIIMTIHQPSARIFNIIDSVIFLCEGRLTYRGPTLGLQPFIEDCYQEADLGAPPISNAPEVFLDLMDDLKKKDQVESVMCSKFSKDGVISSKEVVPASPESKTVESSFDYSNDIATETFILVHRAFRNILRVPELFTARLGSCIFFGFMIGTLFLQTNKDTEDLDLDFLRSYFVFTLAFFYYTSLEALPVFLSEREIFQREYSRGAYRALSYTLATSLVYWPFMFLLAVIYTMITWWLVGLPTIGGLIIFNVITLFTVLIAGISFATLFSVLVPNAMVGQTAGSGVFSVMFLFSGFFINRTDIPAYWIWIYYLSLFQYAYSAFIVNAFKGADLTTPTMDNQAVLEYYGAEGVNRWTGIGLLWLFIVVLRSGFHYRLTTAFSGSRK